MRPLALAAALLASAPAHAVYQCGPQRDDCQCGMNNPYPCCDNGGNCTWWAWEAACCNWGVGLPGWGNANQWAGNARANGNYAVRDWPVTSAVSCRASGQYGHVAYVIRLNGAGITVTEQNCWGNYGMREWNYGDWHWFDGGYITRAGQVQCRPGVDTQTQGCGKCGSQSRGCGNDGKWGGWGGCGGEGPCAPNATEERACGMCGKQKRTCGGACQWSEWSACAGEGVCAAGAKEMVACERCGAATRACSATCQWDPFGECAGAGACEPGATEDQACGACGLQSRTCDETCAWGAFDACAERKPNEPCDTGKPGACAKGTRRCGEATCAPAAQPSAEACNALDDDCDGEADEGLDCPDAGRPAVDGGSEAPVGVGCGCGLAAAPLLPWAFAAALAFLRRR